MARKPSSPSATIGATMRPSTAFPIRAASSFQTSPGVTWRIHRVQGGQKGSIEVPLAQLGQHDAIEDGLALALAQVGGSEACARLEVDGTVLTIGLHVEEDDEAVVETGTADTPLVAERLAVRCGDIGIGARLGLRVDDDLGAGPRLDGLDQAGRLGLGRVGEDARLVVDHDPGHGCRERWPGRQRRARREQEPTQGDRAGRPVAERGTVLATGSSWSDRERAFGEELGSPEIAEGVVRGLDVGRVEVEEETVGLFGERLLEATIDQLAVGIDLELHPLTGRQRAGQRRHQVDDLAGVELGPRVELEASESVHAVGDRTLVLAARAPRSSHRPCRPRSSSQR